MIREELLAQFSEPIKVLDHGFVQLIDVMGDDQAVLQAARTSTQASSKGEEADRKLLRYLFRNRHATPFEACNIKLLIKLPIFVERQYVRHRASWQNEVSARYTKLPDEWYVPDPSRIQKQSKSNKQGSGEAFDPEDQELFASQFDDEASDLFREYGHRLEAGMAKELARINMPVSAYTQKVWGTSLRMLMHMLTLRNHPHAQWEIRQYAKAICTIVEAWCPWTYEAWEDYSLNAHTFSGPEMDLVQYLVAMAFDHENDIAAARKELADRFDIGTIRERKAFWDALNV